MMSASPVLRLVILLASSSLALADDGGLQSKSCVARDLAVFTLIEARGEAESVRPQVLADASIQLIEARNACQRGRTGEALAIYDRIAATLIRSDAIDPRKDP